MTTPNTMIAAPTAMTVVCPTPQAGADPHRARHAVLAADRRNGNHVATGIWHLRMSKSSRHPLAFFAIEVALASAHASLLKVAGGPCGPGLRRRKPSRSICHGASQPRAGNELSRRIGVRIE
jgi:hypothetical protein